MSPIPTPPAGWRAAAERAVIRGRRIDAAIPSFLLDSPVSRVGYWYGSAVVSVLGTLWRTGPVHKRECLLVFSGMPRWTFRCGC